MLIGGFCTKSEKNFSVTLSCDHLEMSKEKKEYEKRLQKGGNGALFFFVVRNERSKK